MPFASPVQESCLPGPPLVCRTKTCPTETSFVSSGQSAAAAGLCAHSQDQYGQAEHAITPKQSLHELSNQPQEEWQCYIVKVRDFAYEVTDYTLCPVPVVRKRAGPPVTRPLWHARCAEDRAATQPREAGVGQNLNDKLQAALPARGPHCKFCNPPMNSSPLLPLFTADNSFIGQNLDPSESLIQTDLDAARASRLTRIKQRWDSSFSSQVQPLPQALQFVSSPIESQSHPNTTSSYGSEGEPIAEVPTPTVTPNGSLRYDSVDLDKDSEGRRSLVAHVLTDSETHRENISDSAVSLV